jgi:hypothetical protein
MWFHGKPESPFTCGAAMLVTCWTRRPRDLFRKRYWVMCLGCMRKAGPFTRGEADGYWRRAFVSESVAA